MSSFVERVVDVIGADPNIPDSVFREMFSAAGDMYVPRTLLLLLFHILVSYR